MGYVSGRCGGGVEGGCSDRNSNLDRGQAADDRQVVRSSVNPAERRDYLDIDAYKPERGSDPDRRQLQRQLPGGIARGKAGGGLHNPHAKPEINTWGTGPEISGRLF